MKDRTRQGYPGAQAPEKGRAIPPRSEETGLPSPFTVIMLGTSAFRRSGHIQSTESSRTWDK